MKRSEASQKIGDLIARGHSTLWGMSVDTGQAKARQEMIDWCLWFLESMDLLEEEVHYLDQNVKGLAGTEIELMSADEVAGDVFDLLQKGQEHFADWCEVNGRPAPKEDDNLYKPFIVKSPLYVALIAKLPS